MALSLVADTSAFRAQGCNRVKEPRVKGPALPCTVFTKQFNLTVVLNHFIFPHRRLYNTLTPFQEDTLPSPQTNPRHTPRVSV